MIRARHDIQPRTYKRFGPTPIPSSQFGFDPFALSHAARSFYERWHRQGGQSARDCCGIMRRARDFSDLRSDEQKRAWQMIDWELRQRAAQLRLQSFGTPRNVVHIHSAR
jgi:hypothetical protein